MYQFSDPQQHSSTFMIETVAVTEGIGTVAL
jgi:hypothetical protein